MPVIRNALLGLALACMAPLASAADPITIIWPAPPGGGGDIYFRILAKVIERDAGVPVVVTNISGAGGSIGVAKMVASRPDGTTLAGAWTGPISIAPHTLGVSYTPADYIPVMQFSSAPYVLCTQAAFPASTGAELLGVLKKAPNKYTFGTDGPGGMGQLAATRIFLAAGITQRDIPYKGAGESSVALLGGHVDIYAIEIEDNHVPSRFPEPTTNGQKAPSRHADIVSAAEQVGKLKAAVAARRDPDTVIVARTSAFDELAMPEAPERIRAYSDTGVEALMFPNLPNGRASIEAISKATRLPLFLLRMPADAVADPAFLAANRVLIRYVEQSPYAMAVKAIHDGLKHLKDGGAPAELKPRQASAELLRAVDRTEEFRKWQQAFLRD